MTERKFLTARLALAESAVRSGCRFYTGYPIEPVSGIHEYMAQELPKVGGVYLHCSNEVEGIHMVWGAAGAGVRSMTGSVALGMTLMQEGIAEMACRNIPAVIVTACRSSFQGEYYQATRGGGHGDYRTIVLGPQNAQEMADYTSLAFYLSDKYLLPVVILTDAFLCHTAEIVELRDFHPDEPLPPKTWATTGAKGRPSIFLGGAGRDMTEMGLGDINAIDMNKLRLIQSREARADIFAMDDAEFMVVAFGTAARFARPAIKRLRARGIKVGLVRPITLWPYPSELIAKLAAKVRGVIVFELNEGQMIDDVRSAVFGAAPVHWMGSGGRIKAGFGTLWSVEDVEKRLGEITERELTKR